MSARMSARSCGRFSAAVAWAADRARRGGGRRWVLACPDAWDFAAGLFGLLKAGGTVVLPPNFLPETLRGREREADGVLWESGSAPAGPPAVLEGRSYAARRFVCAASCPARKFRSRPPT